MATRPDRLPARPLGYEDYCALPEDGNRWELLDGDLLVTPAPRPGHQLVLGNLYALLRPWVDTRHLGTLFLSPVDLILAVATPGRPYSHATITQPDLVFVAAGRESIVTDRAIEAPPDLVVEILSPATRETDRTTKATLYARFGVPAYWLFDPDERVFEAWQLPARGRPARRVARGRAPRPKAARYRLAARAEGRSTVAAPPFPDLTIDLSHIWC